MSSSVKLRWHGLRELRQQLKTLAPDMAEKAVPYVPVYAERAAEAMRAKYRHVTGHLAGSVRVRKPRRTKAGVSVKIENTALYARWFELGTKYTAPGRVFIPILYLYRRMLYADVGREVLPGFNFWPVGDASL